MTQAASDSVPPNEPAVHRDVGAFSNDVYIGIDAAGAVALVFAVWFLFRDTRWRWLIVGVGAAVAFIVGIAVVSGGLHCPADALASIVGVLAIVPVARMIVFDGGVGW